MVTHNDISSHLHKKRGLIALCVALMALCQVAQAQQAIGQWRDHFAFTNAKHIADGGNRIYVAYQECIGYYDIDEDVVGRYTKADVLSDAGIATIAYDRSTKQLVVAYNNSNIDIIGNDQAYTISDLKRATMSGDKNIYGIAFANKRAYVACGLGIMIIDMVHHEIENTCYLGADGSVVTAYDVATNDSRVFAATAEGVKAIALGDRFPNIGNRWQQVAIAPIANKSVAKVASMGDSLLMLCESFDPQMRHLYLQTVSGYQMIDSGDIVAISHNRGNIVVCHTDSVRIYSADGAWRKTYRTFEHGNIKANDAIIDRRGSLWVGHPWAGLLRYNNDGSTHGYNPRGNVSDDVAFITAFDDKIYITPGGKTSTNANRYIRGNRYRHEDNAWGGLSNANDTLLDFVCMAVNPQEPSQQAIASWGYGIVMVDDNKITKVFNESNSNGAIEPYITNNWRHIRIGAVAYDKNGTLWATNSLANHGLLRYAEGAWKSFETRSMIGTNEIDALLCDSITGYLWMRGRENRLYVHDGVSKMAYVDPNNGSKLNTSRVNCLVQDRMGDLWMGTDKGIKVIYSSRGMFDNAANGSKAAVECNNIVISNDEFAEYLMAYEDVQCIAVDGANRKWVGTANNGLYLISATGQEELHHFTSANSPLPDNQIVALCVQPLTGEVLIGTPHGTVGYRSTATYALSTPHDEVHVFPNPVRPDYKGPIAISGLTNNALVHITDMAGHTVFSTQALGGQAIWNGRTLDGTLTKSGVYYVFASDQEGSNRSVGKILIVR